MSLRERVVALAESQLGEPYYSMNYGESEGFGGMGTNHIGKGWGCAELASYCHNVPLGTRYVGSCWNFAGDALGDPYTNQGGGEFKFVDSPLPGDIVLYLAPGHDGTDAEDYSHAAIYVGNGRVIGAWGKNKPWESTYIPGRGVSLDSVGQQNLGGGWRYVRCTRIDKPEPEPEPEPQPKRITQTGDEMICIIQPDGEGYLEYFDGAKVHPLATPKEADALKEVYKRTHGGAEMPVIALGTKGTPVAKHLHAALKR